MSSGASGDKKRQWRLFVYYGGIFTGVILFLYQLLEGLNGFRERPLSSGQMPYIGAALATILVAYALQMLAYACVLRGLGVHISTAEVFAHYVLSFLPRYIPGTVWGYLGRSEWLKTRCGVPYSVSGLSSILEAGAGLLTAVMVSAISYQWSRASTPFRWMSIPAVLVVCWLSWLTFTKVSRLPLFRKLKRYPFSSDAQVVVELNYWLLSCLIYCLFWLCYGGALNLLLQGLAQRSVGLLQPTFAYTLAWTVGFLILIVPSGLGARETALSLLLVRELQLSAQSASAVSVACRIVVYGAELIWLLAGQLLARIMAGREAKQANIRPL